MARKASDLMSLLAARGRSRSRARSSGLVQQFAAAIGGAFSSVAHRRRVDVHGRKATAATQNLGLVAGAFVLVGVGYLLGSAFPWAVLAGTRGGPDLKADGGRVGEGGIAPGMIGDDMSPLARDYFLTAAYQDKTAAVQAARHLRDHGLPKARPLAAKDGKGGEIFALVVYFEGTREQDATKALLKTVAAPDDTFTRYRDSTAGWPRLPAAER